MPLAKVQVFSDSLTEAPAALKVKPADLFLLPCYALHVALLLLSREFLHFRRKLEKK